MIQKFEDFVNESRFVDLINKKFTGEKRKEDKLTYYQPVYRSGRFKNRTPGFLGTNCVFPSIEDCKKWLYDNYYYGIDDIDIKEYNEDYVNSHEMTIVNWEGNPIDKEGNPLDYDGNPIE